MKRMSCLRATNLCKKYKSKTVVDRISFQINSGEIVGLLGPNGAGKTTSFYMMIGLIRQDLGEVWLDDVDLSTHPMHVRARQGIGYLPQEASVFRCLSVGENILAALEARRGLSKKERLKKMQALLEEFSLTQIIKTQGRQLSGGERRRVEIARALATEPTFILLDEPFAGVDPLSVIELKKIIQHLKQRGLGVLITDHNVREMLDVCDRSYIINQGQQLAEGTSEQLLNNENVKRVYLGDQFRL